jgi:hypothetical protein
VTVPRSAARLPAVLVGLAATAVATAAATVVATAGPAFAADGVTVEIKELPGTFVAGGAPGTVTAVASKSKGDCIKIRWSLVLDFSGVQADRVRVNRIEDDESFPVTPRPSGDSVRVTDRRLDPGRLCEDRSVTARYDITVVGGAVDGDATGAQLGLTVEAFSAKGQLLDRTTVTRDVRGGTSPSAEPTEEAAPSSPPAAGAGGGIATDRTSGASVVRVGPFGFAAGAIMVLLGLGLLIKVRRRARLAAANPRSHR